MLTMKDFIKQELSGWKRWEVLWLVTAAAVIAILSVSWGDNFRGVTAAATGVICVILTGKGKMSCYLFGLVNTILYAWISFEAKYYGEVMLNALYYVPMQFVGWFMWKQHMDAETQEVIKTRLTLKADAAILVAAAAAIYLYGTFLKHLGGNLPYIDSMSTCLSVLAMLLSVRRLMEQWVLWVVIDVVTVYMWFAAYQNGGNDVGILLMWGVYLLNAVIMLIKWYQESEAKRDEL